MAQNTEDDDETELKVSESVSLCTSPKLSGTDDQTSSSSRSSESSDPKPSTSLDRMSNLTRSSGDEGSDLLPPPPLPSQSAAAVLPDDVTVEDRVKRLRMLNRCTGCKRKLGLMGFRCRCGEMFCSDHRYSDRHDCTFDYKAAGREAIARENPVVRAAKILKV